MIKIKNYINGKLSEPSNKKYIDVFNPSNGKIYAQCPNSSKNDLNSAIKSSEKSFSQWSKLKQNERGEI